MTGYDMAIGGICSSSRYSIIEYGGINADIINTAHSLGHL
jgi:hypothetical protein